MIRDLRNCKDNVCSFLKNRLMLQHIIVCSSKKNFPSCNKRDQNMWMSRFCQNLGRPPEVSQLRISILRKVFLYMALQERKHLPDVTFKGRAAHLASSNYLQEISINKTGQPHRCISH